MNSNYPYDPAAVINGAVGSEDDFCMGYLNPGASGNGYISTLKLSVGMVRVENLDEVTEGIVSYDRCEANDAYIGQINMLTASSFCGLNGAVWGYDLASADNLRGNLLYNQPLPDGSSIPVYNVYPLLDATQRLFGTEAYRRFNPLPGAHVICANKDITKKGPVWVWSAIALSILDDRTSGANLFIEDANTCPADMNYEEVTGFLDGTLRKITNSVVLCGADQGVRYKETFAGYRLLYVPENHVGCALTCAPYVTLARRSIPPGRQPSDLMYMSIDQWEKALGLSPLPEIPRHQQGFLGPEGTDPARGVSKPE
ncbi:MAG: histidine decarboxylase [Nitrospirae bacterium]|nr:histidine decarboxylase [Nitrospirota bacterium]